MCPSATNDMFFDVVSIPQNQRVVSEYGILYRFVCTQYTLHITSAIKKPPE